MKTCKLCGRANLDDAYLCAVCGAPLNRTTIFEREKTTRNSVAPRINGFWHAIGLGFKNCANFSGAASADEFRCWMVLRIAIVLSVLVPCALASGELLLLNETITDAIFWTWIVADAATILPTFAVHVRRLHDKEKSGFWILPAAIVFTLWRIPWIDLIVRGPYHASGCLVITFLPTTLVLGATTEYCFHDSE